MCFHAKLTSEVQLGKVDKNINSAVIDNILKRTDLPLHHVSGFQHPKVLIYTNENPKFPTISQWGLVPNWIKNETQKNDIWNKTLNARSETIFEKPSFKESSVFKRCVLYANGFYEFHHFNGKTFPYFIFRKDKKPMIIAGLYSNWINPSTGENTCSFSIVTTKGNEFMGKIHNNPKLQEPRVPIILEANNEEYWLHSVTSSKDLGSIQNIDNNILDAHTVKSLGGKNYPGNIETVSDPFFYSELNPLRLF